VAVLLCLAFGIICLVFFFALIVMIAQKKGITHENNSSSYCCPDVASQLVKAANLSLDPCRNHFMYTCHNWPALRNQIASNHSPDAIYASTISGRFKSPAGKAIFGLHGSCLYTIGRGSELPARAISALLETAKVSRGMAPVDVLRVLIQLSLLHQLHTPIMVDVHFNAQVAVSSLVVRSNPVSRSVMSHIIGDQPEMLKTFNEKLRVNVKPEELSSIMEKLRASNRMKRLHFAENLEPLGSLVANVSKHQWLAMATPFYFVPPPTVLTYSDIDHIRETLHLLITDSSERQEVQLALLITMAGVHLTRYYPYPVPFREPELLFPYCGHLTRKFGSSWRILAKEELTDPKKDDVVRSLFGKIKTAVVVDMQKLFDLQDWTAARHALSSIRLILPADLVARNVSVPVPREDFYSNLLKMQHHNMAEQKRLVNQGFDFIYYHNEFQTDLQPLGKKAVLMSSLSYYLLRFGENTDPAINTAKIGIQMAFFLWQVLFDSKDWTRGTMTRIQEYHSCSTGSVSTSLTQVDLIKYTLQRLSLDSAARSARTEGPKWHLPLNVWGISHLSRAQIFYMMFTTKYCPFETNSSAVITVNALLPGIRDFREAYACPQSVNSASNCSFDF
ncbi:unnamed protein product, partial [Ixodes hexagonus]